MKQISVISLILFARLSNLNAQTLYDKVWVQGTGKSYTTTFNGAVVTNAYLDTMFSPYFDGAANICDKNGNLILMTDGYNVYDKNANMLDNGDSIVPKEIMDKYQFSSYSQSSIFLPFPNNKYYLITPTASDTNIINNWGSSSTFAPFDLMLYSEIDMNANGGQGKVVKKGISFLDGQYINTVGMMACKHGNGEDWWLFKQGILSNTVYKFLVTKNGIYNYGTQYFPAPLFNQYCQNGQMMFSKDGTKFASTVRGNFSVFVADFDRCNGQLSNPKVYPVALSPCYNPFDPTCFENSTEGLCFSPNNQFLYVATIFNVKQLDLLDNDTATQWSHIRGLDTTWINCNTYSNMSLGPNNKIYIGHYSSLGDAMSVIDNPDVKGGGCNFCALCCRFPSEGSSNPPCLPNYHLGAAPLGGTCWPVGIEEQKKSERQLYISPNPASSFIQIEYITPNKNKYIKYELFNALGQVEMQGQIRTNMKNKVSIDNLPNGVYYLKCDGIINKIIKY